MIATGVSTIRGSSELNAPVRPPRSEFEFELCTDLAPAGDQPQAIEELDRGLSNGMFHQTLLGVTGSGKTFTMANVIQRQQRPTIVMAPNKTLAAQLYGEFKEFFPQERGRVLCFLLRLLPT